MRHFGGVFTFLVSQRNHDIRGVDGHLGARSARFFKDFDENTPENLKNFLACGAHGQILSLSGAKSLPTFLTLGVLNGEPRGVHVRGGGPPNAL